MFVSDAASWVVKFGVLATVVVVVGVTEYVATDRRIRRLSDQRLDTVCSDFIFPKLEEEFHSNVEGEPTLRVNVMMYRRRSVLPFRGRSPNPLRRSLRIDFADGAYHDYYEDELEWFSGEGVCGSVISENRTIATPLWVTEREECGMTTEQYNATRHLGSLVSVPVYADGDDEKAKPIGVLNVDTEANIDRETLQNAAEDTIKYANYVGLLV